MLEKGAAAFTEILKLFLLNLSYGLLSFPDQK